MTTTEPHQAVDPARAAAVVEAGVGRRGLLLAAAAMGAGSTLAATSTTPAAAHTGSRDFYEGVLQPGKGRIRGDHYLPSRTADVLWGYVPTVHATPVLSMRSGRTVTIDSVSHEGILEDQGRDPVSWLGGHGVRRARDTHRRDRHRRALRAHCPQLRPGRPARRHRADPRGGCPTG